MMYLFLQPRLRDGEVEQGDLDLDLWGVVGVGQLGGHEKPIG
jgi:hypothetical protein